MIFKGIFKKKEKLFAWLKSTFEWVRSRLDDILERNLVLAIGITTKLRDFLQGDGAVTITALVPGDVDEKIRLALISAFEYALERMLPLGVCRTLATPDERLACFIKVLLNETKERQDSQLNKLASITAKYLDGGRYRTSFYDSATQAKIQQNIIEQLSKTTA